MNKENSYSSIIRFKWLKSLLLTLALSLILAAPLLFHADLHNGDGFLIILWYIMVFPGLLLAEFFSFGNYYVLSVVIIDFLIYYELFYFILVLLEKMKVKRTAAS